MARKLKRNEQETVIGYVSDEDEWTVTSSDPVMIKKVLRIASTYSAEVEWLNVYTVRTQLPFKAISFRKHRQEKVSNDESQVDD